MIKNTINLDTTKRGYETDIRINGKKLNDGICGVRIEITATENPKISFDCGSGYINWENANDN